MVRKPSAKKIAFGLFMAKKSKTEEKSAVVFRINCDYSEYVLVPHNAIEKIAVGCYYRTRNDTLVRGKFLCTWNNSDGSYDEELDEISLKYWNVHFPAIRSMWIARIGNVDNFWHLIKLNKI